MKKPLDETSYGLQQALEGRTVDVLQGLAKVLMNKPPRKKADCISSIVRALGGEGLKKHVEGLDDLSKSALAEVVHGSDSFFCESKFQAKYGDLPKRFMLDERRFRVAHPHTLLNVLMPGGVMPRDIQERLAAFLPEPEAASIAAAPELPDELLCTGRRHTSTSGTGSLRKVTVVETEHAALHDLTAVLRLIDAGGVTVSPATKRVTLSGAKKVLPVLRDGDYIKHKDIKKAGDCMRPFAWPLIVQAAGLATLSGSKLVLSRTGKAALSKPVPDVIRDAWARWLKNNLLDEFNRIEEIKGQSKKGRGGGLTAVRPRREAACAGLAECPAHAWLEVDEFFRFLQASENDFEITHDPWNLYIMDPEYGSLGYAGCHDWSMLQGRYVMCLLWEYAATLGLVDIAHIPPEDARSDFQHTWGGGHIDTLSRYDGLMYFRITPLGAYCLGIVKEYTRTVPEAKPAIQVLGNREVIVRDRTYFETGDALLLDRIALRTADDTWRLDQGRLLRAIEEGITVEAILDFLSAKNQGALPENALRFLEDVGKRAAQVKHAGSAEVFQVDDEATALLILHDTKLKRLCYAADDNRLIVPVEDIAAFKSALRKLGYVACREHGSS